MFELEKAIAEWRQQMLVAGIKTPVPLEELEGHLREDIEQQVKAGVSEQQAFEGSALQVGQAEVLKKEFIRAKGLRGLLGDNQTTRIHHLLGMIWLGLFSWASLKILGGILGLFFILSQQIFGLFITLSQHNESVGLTPGFFAIFLLGYIYLQGIRGSISLYRGEDQGRRIIRLMATLSGIAFIAQIAVFKSVSVAGDIFTVFSLVTIWLLRPPQKSKLATR
jgi:hypothetical protein